MSFCQYSLFDEPRVNQEVKPQRWISLVEQKEFIRFLDESGLKALTSDGKLEWCASIVEKYRCQNNQSHATHIKYQLCGKRGVCPRCSKAYAHKRAGIMYQWIKDNLAKNLKFDLKMNQIVLTLPSDIHDLDKKIFSKMIKSFMKKMRIESYGYTIQERHSHNPLSGLYRHSHILSLNMKECNGSMIQNDYYFDVNEMRNVWKSVIADFTGYEVEGSVNLHTEYASVMREPTQVLHMLAYCYRYPIQDLFDVQVRNKSINYVQDKQFEESNRPNDILQIDMTRKIFELTQDPKPRLVWCGWLTSAKRKELIKMIEIIPNLWNNLKEIEKIVDLRSKTCRDCGCPLEEKPFEVTEYEGDNEPS